MKQTKNMIEFELNETLLFESGQEIDEMVSISLNPDIAVQKYDTYIQIRGLIILQGEYIKANEQSHLSESSYNEKAKGFIEKVMETNEGHAQFSHRFPVEISVPLYRVEDLNQIMVTVDSFDYELPDVNQLKLSASVHINGIKADVETSEINEEVQEIDQTEGEVQMAETEASSFEHRENEKTDDHVTQDRNEQEDIPFTEVSDGDKGETSSHVTELIESETIEKEESIAEEQVGVEEVAEHVEVFDKESSEVDTTDENEIDIMLSENKDDNNEEEVKDVRFLTDLFGGEVESEYSKMRIYIAQEEDTVESIAKRYEMSTLQLIKDNNLTEEGLEEGQLLYIPVK